VGTGKTFQNAPIGESWWVCAVGVETIEMTSKPRVIKPLGMSLAGARVLARWCPA
jgi:hypothetical protein